MEVWVAKGSLQVFSTEEKGLTFLEKCRQESLAYAVAKKYNRKPTEIITWKDGSRHYFKCGSCSVAIRKITVDGVK
jgi:hypothetical protein